MIENGEGFPASLMHGTYIDHFDFAGLEPMPVVSGVFLGEYT